MQKINLNADVGEEAGFDDKIMPFISWCNIACGSHAGNDDVIQKTIELAIKNNVKIGAHPSYPDRENFGRISMNINHSDLVETISDQIQKVKYFVEKAGEELHHVKPHGALYNDAAKNKEVLNAVIESVKNIDKRLPLITLKNNKNMYLSQQELSVKFEAFADRNYNEDLTLVSRTENDAVIVSPEQVFEHVFKMISEGVVKTKIGKEVPVIFDTICIHGDNPNAVDILKYLQDRFRVLNFTF